jgi:hypothetical protein
MDKNSLIFERILQIIEFYDIKSVNSFAKDHLGYDSSEKIARLKDPNKRPSFEILEDISNKFAYIDLNWLVTGNGSMLKNSDKNDKIENESSIDKSNFNVKQGDFNELSAICKNQLQIKDKTISDLLKHQEVLITQISKLTDKIK